LSASQLLPDKKRIVADHRCGIFFADTDYELRKSAERAARRPEGTTASPDMKSFRVTPVVANRKRWNADCRYPITIT
jgi:hypothetical protein